MEAGTLGRPSGDDWGVEDLAPDGVWGGPTAARLAQESVPLVLYGLLTERERRRPFSDGEDDILCKPRSKR